MNKEESAEEDPDDFGTMASLCEVRYSLSEMMAEVRQERRYSALGRELVDATEINKMFKLRKRKKST